MLWRLLRIGSAPYFVLGHRPPDRCTRSLSHRRPVGLAGRSSILDAFVVTPAVAGQPRVDWTGTYRTRRDGGSQKRGRPCRDPVEPRPLRPTSGGQGLPRHADGTPSGLSPPGAARSLATDPVEHRLTTRAGWADDRTVTWDGESYQQRFDALAASGADVHGEADFVAQLHPSSVLDAGCGTGRVARELARRGVDVVGVDRDASMIATARRLAPELTWLVRDLTGFDLGRSFDVVLMAGNVPIFTPGGHPGDAGRRLRTAIWPPDGSLVAGFQLDRGYTLADYDEHCRQAGLECTGRWATWSRDPFAAGGDYAVSVHRLSDSGPTRCRADRAAPAATGGTSATWARRTPCEIPMFVYDEQLTDPHPRLLPMAPGPRPGPPRLRRSPGLVIGGEPRGADQPRREPTRAGSWRSSTTSWPPP